MPCPFPILYLYGLFRFQTHSSEALAFLCMRGLGRLQNIRNNRHGNGNGNAYNKIQLPKFRSKNQQSPFLIRRKDADLHKYQEYLFFFFCKMCGTGIPVPCGVYI